MLRALVLRWPAHCAAGDINRLTAQCALLYCSLIGSSFKNWLVLRMNPPLRGEDKYPRMLMVIGLMKNRFDEAFRFHLPQPPSSYE